MKYNFAISIVIVLFLAACKDKASEESSGSLMLTGINSSKGSEIVTIDLDSGFVDTSPVSCYVMSSTVYDPNTGGYGYVSCDTTFTLTNTETGSVIKSIKLPGLVSGAVVDKDRNLLTGTYGEFEETGGPDSSKNSFTMIWHTFLFTLNLTTGDVILDKEVDLGDGVYLCTNFFDPVNKLYVVERSDKKLVFIDPITGEITNTVDVGKPLTNIVYNPDDGNIMSMRYDSESGKCYIEVYDLSSATLLNSSIVDGIDSYRYCMAAYDPVTGCYLSVSSDDEVLFIDPSTGEIKKSVKLDYTLSDIRFLRK